MGIVFLFYEGMTALDAIGPHEILCRLPEAEVARVAAHRGPVRTDSQLILMADYSLSDISHAIKGAGKNQNIVASIAISSSMRIGMLQSILEITIFSLLRQKRLKSRLLSFSRI